MPDNKNALPLGTILNTRYKIEGLVGGGGFGLVYRTKHIYLNSIVAIKELFPRDIVVRQDKAVHPISDAEVALYQKVLNSFRKEGQRLARLGNCPSIVRCQDYFEENSTGYLVMEYVEGKSLRELVRTYRKAGKPFSEDALVSLVSKLSTGLKEVHKAGIQHMDIKPENIYLRQTEASGELGSPVLLDFGASRSQTGHSTGSSLLVGTVPYAPLEQMYEGGAIGPWTDIYALGITLYELVFEGVNIPGSTERVSEFHGKGIDPLEAAKSKGKSGYSEKFLELIDKSIEIKAADRPQNVEELEQKLSLKSEQRLHISKLDTDKASDPRSEDIEHPPRSWDEEENLKHVVETLSSKYQGKQKRDKQETGSKKVKRMVIKLLILPVLVGSWLYIDDVRQVQIETERQAKLEAERQVLVAGKRANKVGESFLDCATCPVMVIVPSGSFMMGSPADERDNQAAEEPQHPVRIQSFAVSKYEVTRGQFAAFVAATGYDAGNCYMRENLNWRNLDFEQNDDHPVVCVSWRDARAYVKWLSEKTGEQYRLLSESEWEYAARARTTTPYYFGTTISPGQANYDDNNSGTVVVGSYPANAFGLHDMHGNVWEWVEDCWHEDYNGAPSDGHAWTIKCDDEDDRVLRGGSWYINPRILRSADRSYDDAGNRNSNFGFRIARTLTPKVGDTSSEEIESPPKSGNKEVIQKQVGDTFRDCGTCPDMVVVPSGSFMMGSPADERGRESDEGPQHRVTISKPFAVGKYEVTVGQFEEFANETRHWVNSQYFKQSANHPAGNVSWKDAKAYTGWLSEKTGQNYRLLNEAEWEYVARAGTTTAYHFGADITHKQANYGYASRGTVKVGSYPANAFGLHDMHGNVWEWVEDCGHNNYNGAPTDGRAWTIDCDEGRHLLRGGSWIFSPNYLRSAYRGREYAGVRNRNFGFRIARTLTP